VEVSDMVEGLVDQLIQRFIKKQFAVRQRAPLIPTSADDVTRISLPVFPPPPPPLFPTLFPVPVCGSDIVALRNAYAERRAYVDALVRRARTQTDTACSAYQRDVTAANRDNSISGCTPMTSSSSDNIDHRSPPMSSISSRCLLPDQPILQPPIQVRLSIISQLISILIIFRTVLNKYCLFK